MAKDWISLLLKANKAGAFMDCLDAGAESVRREKGSRGSRSIYDGSNSWNRKPDTGFDMWSIPAGGAALRNAAIMIGLAMLAGFTVVSLLA